MVGFRWALRRLGQQGALNSNRGLSKREGLERTWQFFSRREYSSAGRGIGLWGACFDGGQPHEVPIIENESSQSLICLRELERRQGCCERQAY